MINISEIRVNFNSPDILPDGNNFGKVGEHNATVLNITPPDYMSGNENIVLYCLAFETGNDFIKKIIRSEMIPKADVIHVPLWSQVTASENIRFQLEGYDGENNLLVKSTMVEGVFSPSVNGVQSPSDFGNNGMSATVAANTFARHTHKNSDVIDKLSEEDGNLFFDKKPINGGSRLTDSVEFTPDDNIQIYEESYGSFGVLVGVFLEPHANISVGTEIADVEVRMADINNGEYFSIRDMIAFDVTPYLSFVRKVYIDMDYDMPVWLRLLFFTYPFSGIAANLSNYGYTSIRITYYTN